MWQEIPQAPKSIGSGLKGNRLVRLLCKFHTCAHYSWQVIMARIHLFQNF